jgi:hypothetical protein
MTALWKMIGGANSRLSFHFASLVVGETMCSAKANIRSEEDPNPNLIRKKHVKFFFGLKEVNKLQRPTSAYITTIYIYYNLFLDIIRAIYKPIKSTLYSVKEISLEKVKPFKPHRP